MADVVSFFVLGTAAPQGSKKAFIRGGRAILAEASKKSRPWRDSVIWAAHEAAEGQHFKRGEAVKVEVDFVFARPASHYTGTGKLRRSAPRRHTQSPDLDKLQRAVGDALTQSGVIHDDRQIDLWHARKRWDTRASTAISIRSRQED